MSKRGLRASGFLVRSGALALFWDVDWTLTCDCGDAMELAGEALANGDADELAGNGFPDADRGANPSVDFVVTSFEEAGLDTEAIVFVGVTGLGCDGDCAWAKRVGAVGVEVFEEADVTKFDDSKAVVLPQVGGDSGS